MTLPFCCFFCLFVLLLHVYFNICTFLFISCFIVNVYFYCFCCCCIFTYTVYVVVVFLHILFLLLLYFYGSIAFILFFFGLLVCSVLTVLFSFIPFFFCVPECGNGCVLMYIVWILMDFKNHLSLQIIFFSSSWLFSCTKQRYWYLKNNLKSLNYILWYVLLISLFKTIFRIINRVYCLCLCTLFVCVDLIFV